MLRFRMSCLLLLWFLCFFAAMVCVTSSGCYAFRCWLWCRCGCYASPAPSCLGCCAFEDRWYWMLRFRIPVAKKNLVWFLCRCCFGTLCLNCFYFLRRTRKASLDATLSRVIGYGCYAFRRQIWFWMLLLPFLFSWDATLSLFV